MISFRTKIVSSLIGLSLVSFSMGAYYTQSVLSDRFEDVVVHRYAEGLSRAALAYYRRYGSWERSYQSESFTDFSRGGSMTSPPPPPGSEVTTLTSDSQRPRFAVTDLQGRVWIPGPGFDVGDLVSGDTLKNAFPIYDLEEHIGYVIPLGTVETTAVEDEFLQLVSDTWWMSLLLVTLMAVPVGLVLGKHFSEPINNLMSAISVMGPSSMRQKVPVNSRDELGMLSQSFNQMSDDLADFVQVIKSQRKKISETETVLRQSLVSASHELRTPLNQTMNRVHAMLDGYRELNKEQVAKLGESLEYLIRLVDDLYQLSLEDVQALKYDQERVDFAALVQDCTNAVQDDFSAKDIRLHLYGQGKLELNGDKTRLRQIVDNLLSNCLRYVPSGAEVDLDLRKKDGMAELTVTDTGHGVPKASLQSLFDRFYRVDASRSRSRGGAGLGLSIVKTCAEIHGGEVEAFINEDGGLGILVKIPIS